MSPEEAAKHAPKGCTGTYKKVMQGDPDPGNISTSFVERQNLTVAWKELKMTEGI